MSLPDTAFIFVLALIIFGPKKLPEIGRQLGRLVAEFRRASNEFKFQIEEELRLAELSDQQKTTAAPDSEELYASEPSPEYDSPSDDGIAESNDVREEVRSDGSDSSDTATSSDEVYAEELMPVGQHPNPEYRGSYQMDDSVESQGPVEAGSSVDASESADTTDAIAAMEMEESVPSRTILRHTTIEHDSTLAAGTMSSSADVEFDSIPEPEIPAVTPVPAPQHDPVHPYTASTVADVSHG